MTEVHIRNVEGWVVEFHRRLAKQEGRSLEGELRQVLTDAAFRRKREIAADLRADLHALEEKHGLFSYSARIIREMRDTRG